MTLICVLAWVFMAIICGVKSITGDKEKASWIVFAGAMVLGLILDAVIGKGCCFFLIIIVGLAIFMCE